MEGCKVEEKKEKKEMKEEKEKKEKKEMNEEKEKLEKKEKKVDEEEEKLSFVPLEMLVNNHFFKEKEEKEGEEFLKDMFLDVSSISVCCS